MRGGWSKTFAVMGAVGLLAVSACGNSNDNKSGATASKDVTVFTWWADGGEKAGLDGLVSVFKTKCKDYNFVNSAVAGGAGEWKLGPTAQPANEHTAITPTMVERRNI